MLPPVELWRAARGVTPTGPKRTYSRASAMSASEGKADIKYGRMSTRPSNVLHATSRTSLGPTIRRISAATASSTSRFCASRSLLL